ncbi:MAG TPA: DEAD/DEAH box helicase family protein, partial [Candidatus Hodarchaeales archaeon]|nr:DEAD/DEAH box helicase family protein [Candidatus Hodarchaeales archaeon]
MNTTIRQITQRMSLRRPQIKALEVLAEAVELLPMNKMVDPKEILTKLQSKYPQVSDFERGFPNLSFALATGVGKTRLMGAMIAYLSSVKNVRDFVLLAPNTTILEKLVREFSNPNDPKYVFRGISEFANKPPTIVTSENFDEGYGVRNQWANQSNLFGGEDIHIYIFNISMINSENRRMKSPRETIVGGMSYFEYLSQIENLIVFMDEAHRYRAPNSWKAIGELNPILGIEMSATPQIEVSGRSVMFQNIIYEYPLSEALKDGYVKEPWVAGRENFKNSQLTDDALERLKIEDGLRIHEGTKIHLQNYCYETGRPPVKPFMLIIAVNLAHANRLESLIKNDEFFEGQYKSKVRVVHSGVKLEEEERMVRNLLEIESFQNPIEIVIHVNMLKEGWDVVNLYTIVPLRA